MSCHVLSPAPAENAAFLGIAAGAVKWQGSWRAAKTPPSRGGVSDHRAQPGRAVAQMSAPPLPVTSDLAASLAFSLKWATSIQMPATTSSSGHQSSRNEKSMG